MPRKPIILLGIDGVLNPVARAGSGGDHPEPILPDSKVALVRRLAELGRIAWVSTWPADLTAALESQLQLEGDPLRVTLLVPPGDEDEPTPKLRSVIRWLARMERSGCADWDSVVWIDDVLGQDARKWAHGYGQPVLLGRPVPDQGLSAIHVVAVEVFVDPLVCGRAVNSSARGRGQ
ncbi:HAD domain-containing protein [Arthrobacter sp. B10-11]|uniref:HAD domain-containing protein n=1 Tax=Arthrobacter sp. B10-11 TaxID=3081160 RepID=UPI002954EB74|nr:HAD domain-containing protein [Arthrobacter sp. B10-11]MDV8147192.1 HAD domain-containing protein [Arthrobacter sp. B10-11]